MSAISPGVDACEENDGRRSVTHKRKLAPELRHPQPGVEDIAKELLLIRGREVFDLAADMRRYFGRHGER